MVRPCITLDGIVGYQDNNQSLDDAETQTKPPDVDSDFPSRAVRQETAEFRLEGHGGPGYTTFCTQTRSKRICHADGWLINTSHVKRPVVVCVSIPSSWSACPSTCRSRRAVGARATRSVGDVTPTRGSRMQFHGAAMRAEVSTSSYQLLQRLQAQLRDGLPLRLVALGGSSTAGHAYDRNSPLLYFARLAQWVNESRPHGQTLVTNSGTPAAGPTYMEKCLTSQLPAQAEPNLVLVEYSQNCDTWEDGLALERLLRRLLQLPAAPAVVYVALPNWNELLARGSNATRKCPYDAELAAHYGVPFVRPFFPRTELLELFSEKDGPMREGTHAAHPTAQGHAIVAAALRRLLSKAWSTPPAAGLFSNPRARPSLPLPPPRYSRDARVRHSELKGNTWRSSVSRGAAGLAGNADLPSTPSPRVPNYELPSSLCMSGAELAPYVLASTDGFHPVVEGSRLHPKPGYAAQHAGARLSLCHRRRSRRRHAAKSHVPTRRLASTPRV